MKTAMQELKDKLKSYSLLIKFSQNVDGVFTIIEKDINELLEKEKEQILRAFELGMHESLAYDANSITYYNQTYNQNK